MANMEIRIIEIPVDTSKDETDKKVNNTRRQNISESGKPVKNRKMSVEEYQEKYGKLSFKEKQIVHDMAYQNWKEAVKNGDYNHSMEKELDKALNSVYKAKIKKEEKREATIKRGILTGIHMGADVIKSEISFAAVNSGNSVEMAQATRVNSAISMGVGIATSVAIHPLLGVAMMAKSALEIAYDMSVQMRQLKINQALWGADAQNLQERLSYNAGR